LLKIEYNHTNYEEILNHFADTFKTRLKENTLTLPAAYGKGFMKLIQLPNGLQAIISDYTVHQDILFQRNRINENFFTLRFDEVIVPEGGEEAAEQAPVAGTGALRTAVYLGSAKFDWLFLANKNTKVKGINIFFSKAWLEQFVGIEIVGDLIKKYLNLKMSAFNYEPMDTEYKRILAEIVNNSVDGSLSNMVIYNRVMLLIERFFTRIYSKINDSHFDVKLSNDDITSLKQVQSELVKDFSVEPPSINKLAKMAAMSPSKLKNSFKEIYGLPIYQYFQKHRMNKAKAMLLSRKYSVKEVGIEVGFSNLSNFAKAFKKSFDQLPSDLIGNK
jgi:AraC-like DNA-binding protein